MDLESVHNYLCDTLHLLKYLYQRQLDPYSIIQPTFEPTRATEYIIPRFQAISTPLGSPKQSPIQIL